jgi:hypothetical protein
MITINKQRPSGTPDDVRGTMEDLAKNRDEHEYHSGAWFRELTVKLAMCEDLAVSAVTSDDGRFMTWRWSWFLRDRKNPDLPRQPTWGTQVLQSLVALVITRRGYPRLSGAVPTRENTAPNCRL